MCVLYSMTKRPDQIRDLFKNTHNLVGNIEPLPAIAPNAMAPIVRTAPDGEREIVLMRWGFATPPVSGLKTRGPYLPHVHHAESRLWRSWLERPSQRCLVPATSFAVRQDEKRHWVFTWFAKDESRSLMFFPGIWQEWKGNRGTAHASNFGTHLLFSILTVDASPDIKRINRDVLPAVLPDQDSCEQWMTAPIGEALLLRKPSPAGSFARVAVNVRQDQHRAVARKGRRSNPEGPGILQPGVGA